MAKFNQPDPRNNDTQCWVNGLVSRDKASVHVLDSVVQGGDAVWEGLRITKGHAIQLDAHLKRLVDSAHALAFVDIPSMETLRDSIFQTLKANGMRDGVHCRITLTRGKKSTSGMDPKLNVYGSTLIVVPEYKGMVYGNDGIKLVTSAIRRNSPQFLDSHIHHNNLLNNILAKIDANVAGADDAIMLDDRGFLAETNATNLFLIRKGQLLTPFAHACLPGLTRRFVLDVAHRVGIEAREADLTLAELYTADEAFTTGTMGALAHIIEVDGRQIGNGDKGAITERMQQSYEEFILETATSLPF